MVTAYDFEDDEHSNDLSDVGKKLLACKSKDTLIKLLKVYKRLSSTSLCHVASYFKLLGARPAASWGSA